MYAELAATPVDAAVEAGVLLWIQAAFAVFLGWLLIFALAWIFPYAWKGIGLVTGLLWGVAPLILPLWQKWFGEPNLLIALWHFLSTPLVAFLQAAGLPGDEWISGPVALALGTGAGLASAWTGNAFRLFSLDRKRKKE